MKVSDLLTKLLISNSGTTIAEVYRPSARSYLVNVRCIQIIPDLGEEKESKTKDGLDTTIK